MHISIFCAPARGNTGARKDFHCDSWSQQRFSWQPICLLVLWVNRFHCKAHISVRGGSDACWRWFASFASGRVFSVVVGIDLFILWLLDIMKPVNLRSSLCFFPCVWLFIYYRHFYLGRVRSLVGGDAVLQTSSLYFYQLWSLCMLKLIRLNLWFLLVNFGKTFL